MTQYTRDDARAYLKTQTQDYAERFLQPDKATHNKAQDKRGYICPNCESGKGKKGTGMTYNKKDGRYKCFACGKTFDIFDLIEKTENITDFNEKLKRACELYGIEIVNSYTQERQQEAKAEIEQMKKEQQEAANAATKQAEQADYTEYYNKVKNHITEKEAADYLASRGFTVDFAKAHNIGYDSSYIHPTTWREYMNDCAANPETKKPYSTARLIIPINRSSYIARAINAAEKLRYMNSPNVALYNEKSLYKENVIKPVFVVEGAIDALSIISVGGQAVALNSTSNKTLLIELIKKTKPTQPVIIALDADEAGKTTANEIEQALREQETKFIKIGYIVAGCKDANEALTTNKEAFTAAIQRIERAAKALLPEAQQIIKDSYASILNRLTDRIEKGTAPKPISTGFMQLDNLLDGGLYSGLYTIGAITGLGKSTFVLQLAHQIAERGQAVYYFSLEMNSEELLVKDLSRQMAKQSELRYSNRSHTNAKTARSIWRGDFIKEYNREQKELYRATIQSLAETDISKKLLIGYKRFTAQEIADRVTAYIQLSGEKPVVIVDYLQILRADEKKRLTDKQKIDDDISTLMYLAHDNEIPVIIITSHNRASANRGLSETGSATGSNGIEYGSDVEIGLQYAAFEEINRLDCKEEDRRQRIREAREDIKARSQTPDKPIKIIAKINKSRLAAGGNVAFNLYPMFSLYHEITETEAEEEQKEAGVQQIMDILR